MRQLNLPIDDRVLESLVAGEEILLTGHVITMRDAALKRLEQMIADGVPPPFNLSGELIFHAGPSPGAAGRPCGAIGPTTAARMDIFLPLLFGLGAKATLGKGPRSARSIDLHRHHGTVYLVTIGGLGALLGGRVSEIETLAFDDLGPEAVYRMKLEDFPAVVAIDSEGRDFLSRRHRKFRSLDSNSSTHTP